MTTEQRVYTTVSDLGEIEISCKHEFCDAKFSWSIERFKAKDRCPNCNGEWFSFPSDSRKEHFVAFVEGLRNLRNNFMGIKFDLRLRIDCRTEAEKEADVKKESDAK